MKLFIPTVLIATIFIAGAFAVLPVQEAVTLHLSGGSAPAGADTVTSASIAAGTIVASDISNTAAITGTQLAANANIAGTQLAANANIAGTQLAANAAIAGTQLAAGANIAGSQMAANAGIASGQIQDDTIGPEDVTGVNAAAALIKIVRAGDNDVDVITPSYTPVVSSTVIVTCTGQGTANANATTDIIVTLVITGTGAIQGAAAHNINSSAAGEFWGSSDTWYVTGVTDASTYQCTWSGTNFSGTDTTNLEVFAMYLPE